MGREIGRYAVETVMQPVTVGSSVSSRTKNRAIRSRTIRRSSISMLWSQRRSIACKPMLRKPGECSQQV